MNKKKLIAVLVIVLCLSVLGDSTAAYFTARGTAHNVITTGNVDIEVVEQQEKDGVLVDYPVQPITGVMPGATVSKIVTVKNTGSGDAWIRVQLSRSITLSPDAPEALPEGETPDAELLQLKIDETDWVEIDGWYYYRKPLPAAASTGALLKEVTFAPEMGNAYQGCTANILVNAQAVQVKNNPLPAGGDYSQIPGWPAK